MMSDKRKYSYTDKAILAHKLEVQWSAEVISEIEGLIRSTSEHVEEYCLDLTRLPFVTIDGIDARDYDDAIYARKVNDGWLLQVAVADVSHYVRPGTALDKTASSRGNSTYFVDRVIPMLPEALSNDLCSLRPEEDRLAIVCNISIDFSGAILEWSFDQAWIRSRFRLTYNEVDQYFKNKEERFHQAWGKAVCESLDIASQIVLARRDLCIETGRIDIGFPETAITLDDNGTVAEIGYRESNNATRLVEECMLSANLCAARTIEKNLDSGVYRVHEIPSPQDLVHLRQVLERFGLTLSGGTSPTIQDLNQTLNVAREILDQEQWVEGLVLRTLKQARYDSSAAPHFALGFDCYTHFTSPIRRYPDLVVHRLIKNIFGYDRSICIGVTNDELTSVSMHCSMTERCSESAERAVVSCLKAQYMLDKIGQVFKGSISGVTEFGVFVQLDDQPIDGLVHVSQLGGDYYEFNPQIAELFGKRTGKTFRLGDNLDVILLGTCPEEGKISFSSVMNNQSTRRKKISHRNKKTRRHS